MKTKIRKKPTFAQLERKAEMAFKEALLEGRVTERDRDAFMMDAIAMLQDDQGL